MAGEGGERPTEAGTLELRTEPTSPGAAGPTLDGTPVALDEYAADCLTNRQFRRFGLDGLDRVFLPPALRPLVDTAPIGRRELLEDDQRGAVGRWPIATIDGRPYYLSVKGVGSSVDPYSHRSLDAPAVAALSDDPEVPGRLTAGPPAPDPRWITGELWLRGSPYGGQGLEHARIALDVSERATLTSIAGFRIAPVVKVAFLPPALEARLRTIYWYRRYPGRFVQELRLVPSNVRIYFHARTTIGTSVAEVFRRFRIGSAAEALAFEVNFVRTTVPLLTLFARTLAREPAGGRLRGLDFHDVWLDKDAVVAPDGSVFFVDLEGIEPVAVEPGDVREKVEDQIYRSLYEFTFAFEQIEQERARRFPGAAVDRRSHFERVLNEALRDDPFAGVRPAPGGLALVVRNPLWDENLYVHFRLLDR